MPLVAARSQTSQVSGLLAEGRPVGAHWQRAREPRPQAVTEPRRGLVAATRALRDCRSAGGFSPAAVSRAQLALVMTQALVLHERDWPPARFDPPALMALVAAIRVTGLRRGTYAAGGSQGAGFMCLARTGWDEAMPAGYGDAAAVLHICGDLSAACGEDGSGYGSLLVRAGALGRAISLAAQSAHLSTATYATASHHVTNMARHLDGALRHLMSVALGAEAGDHENA
jgi:hypothetical protein